MFRAGLEATGFPIAKIAARALAVGIHGSTTIPNDITKMTPSCFEPTNRLRGYEDSGASRSKKFRGAVDELGRK